jgi:acetyl-CoA carboxylase biotin carboxyl carrier protein
VSKPRVRQRPRKDGGRLTALPSTLPRRSAEHLMLNDASGDQLAQIQELVDFLKRNNLTELEVEREGFRVRLRHETGARPAVAAAGAADFVSAGPHALAESATIPLPAETAGKVTITSPIVGTFYRSASPDADPYVEEGDLVKKGQVLCIVEAMKLMNEIESEIDGRIVKILAESTKPVEYGQPLFLIDPTPTS